MSGGGELKGPDLASEGASSAEVAEGGMLLGHAQGEAVLIARSEGKLYAIGASCTHYGGPLAEGVLSGDRVRCPWHHAQFCLKDGSSRAPALNPVPCWKVEESAGRVRVTGKVEPKPPARREGPESVVIVGAGPAGNVAAEALRANGYEGPITLIGGESPVDRPNLSKDYLAGTAQAEWIPLRPKEFYQEKRIECLFGARVTRIDPAARSLTLQDGKTVRFGALLLATGAEANRLQVPGGDLPHVRTLRSLADSDAIIARAAKGKRAVVVGASFIGLEAAASLRARGVEVHVVAPESVPAERVLGRELGGLLRKVHEEHGVVFHLGDVPASIDEREVVLKSGTRLPADVVVAGVGVRPGISLAEQAGLTVDRGIVVDEFLRTSAPAVWAAGDVARIPDPRTGQKVRIEHWVVAERQAEAAAKNMLGFNQPYRDVPFFWTNHYDLAVNYVGHAEKFDSVQVAGNLHGRDAIVAYREGSAIRAVATVGRDRAALEAELAFEQGDDAALERLLR
ncbi:MAG TPA: FAD-dependent oxidoreductase [Myxococcales bacterium]